MNQQPKVSIIVNNYNYGRFLGEAIDSALTQTYLNVEVIVVDDGSTDNSREIVARYGNRIIPVLKENGGQGSALNAGFRASTGDLILFLDSDDILEPYAMETVVEEWRDSFSRVHFLLRVVDKWGEPSGETVGGVTLPNVLLGPFSSGTSTSGNVLARWALEKVMPMPEPDWRTCADYYVCATTSLFGEVKCIEKPLGRYRAHGGNNVAGSDVRFHAASRVILDVSLHKSLYELTGGRIGSVEKWLSRAPNHWMARIRWLKESPATYPFPDSSMGLTLRAVRASCLDLTRKLYKRLAFSVYALAYGLLPRKLTRSLGKIIPMWRIVAIKELRREVEVLRQAAARSR